MWYSTEPRVRRYVEGYGVLSVAKNIGKNIISVVKNFSTVLKRLQEIQ